MIFIHAPAELKDYAYRVADHLGLDSYGETDVFIEYEVLGDIDGAIYGDHESACIELNEGSSLTDKLKALAHEMIHAQQLFRGDLTYIKADMYWKGEKMTDVPYFEQGHEVEAFKLEKEIYEMCK